jgi:hypothetical protein
LVRVRVQVRVQMLSLPEKYKCHHLHQSMVPVGQPHLCKTPVWLLLPLLLQRPERMMLLRPVLGSGKRKDNISN